MQKTHISVQHLSVFYDGVAALKDVTVDIPDRQITAIIGPSGCGKSTLLKSFNRLLDPEDGITIHGRVLVDGEDVFSKEAEITHIRKKMGLLLQKPVVLPMSIYDNVVYGPRLHGEKDKKTLEGIVEFYLKQAGLWDEVKNRLHDSASKLSLGQQQKLCLARGLAVKPEIVLGDEPTSALDPVSSQRIEQRFLELKKEYTIVVVTHILRQARRLADYVVFLYLGELIECGPADEIFSNPKHAMTKEYMKGVIS